MRKALKDRSGPNADGEELSGTGKFENARQKALQAIDKMREKCPSNCQNRAECCKTSNLVGSHQWQDPEFLSAVRRFFRREDGPIPAAVRNVPAETDAPMLLPEEIDVAANAAATSGNDGEAAEVARHDERQWLDGGR